jgi:hypothetical protein
MRRDLTAEELEKAWQTWRTTCHFSDPVLALNPTDHTVGFEYDGAVWARLYKPFPVHDETITARIIIFTSSDGRHIGGGSY